MNAQQRCRIRTLPVELREAIYEFAFTSDMPSQDSGNLVFGVFQQSKSTLSSGSGSGSYEDGKTNLLDPHPPSKALLLSCKFFYQEARAFYITAYRQYWATTEFVLRHSDPLSRIKAKIESLHDNDTWAITHLGLKPKNIWPELTLDGDPWWLYDNWFPRRLVYVSDAHALAVPPRVRTSHAWTDDGGIRRKILVVMSPSLEGGERLVSECTSCARRTHLTKEEIINMVRTCQDDESMEARD